MSECCKTCNYFCEVRKYPTYQEVLTHICVYFLLQEGSGYIMEVKENDMCECWIEYKENEVK